MITLWKRDEKAYQEYLDKWVKPKKGNMKTNNYQVAILLPIFALLLSVCFLGTYVAHLISLWRAV